MFAMRRMGVLLLPGCIALLTFVLNFAVATSDSEEYTFNPFSEEDMGYIHYDKDVVDTETEDIDDSMVPAPVRRSPQYARPYINKRGGDFYYDDEDFEPLVARPTMLKRPYARPYINKRSSTYASRPYINKKSQLFARPYINKKSTGFARPYITRKRAHYARPYITKRSAPMREDHAEPKAVVVE